MDMHGTGRTVDNEDAVRRIGDSIWNYIRAKHLPSLLNGEVRFFRAVVEEAPDDGRIKISRPFDTPITLPCAASAETLRPGNQCLVLVFGGDSNGIVICDGALKMLPNLITSVFPSTCSTAAATENKVAATMGGAFTLRPGAMVRVLFQYANTYNGTATLNVNGTGAYPIYRTGGSAVTRYFWSAGEVVDFLFDGERYIMEGGAAATTTYYGVTKLSSSTSSTSTSLAATPSAVKAAYDLASAASKKYVLVFSASDWVSGAGGYQISVPPETHGMSGDVLADVYTLSGESYVKFIGTPTNECRVTFHISGDVTLTSTRVFAGKLILRG